MTEEIIIDGVNVWSCKHYDLENNYCDQSYLGEGGLLKNTKNPKRCESSPNCYFKQLKRLEQSNKELIEDNLNLSKENEELCEDNTRLGNNLDYINEELDKYKYALEEIKNLVKEISYLGSRGERELKFKIKNILEDVIDEEIY